MNQNENNNFLDTKTILAIVLVGAVWFGWQSYLNKKYPAQNKNEVVSQTNNEASPTTQTQDPSKIDSAVNSNPSTGTQVLSKNTLEEKFIKFENEQLSFEVSNIGMSLKNILLKKYTDRDSQNIFFNDKFNNLSTQVNSQDINFEITKHDDNTLIGIHINESFQITKKIFIKEYTLYTEVEVLKKNEDSSVQIPELKTLFNDFKRITGESSFFAPSLETQDLYISHAEGNLTESLFLKEKSVNVSQPKINLVGLSSHYFSTAIVDKSDILPDALVNQNSSDSHVFGSLSYKPISSNDKSLNIKYNVFIGPKDLTILESVDPKLAEIINFGMFSSIAKPMLLTMKWFFKIFNNWGVAIILLTLLVRLIVMPLHIMSFKSMKTMQSIQPMIQSIREKYKDDPMQLNRETMELMKKYKVNPLSGCLPMLLQIPVFFALYRVFGQSIELYKAPFIFWIKDLSVLDPYYVLPVLLAIVMYLQQKMTPTTMDPAQAKVMQFLPLIFSLMMISLPSALTLYIFVSTLFGIIQQFMMLKEKNKNVKQVPIS